MKAFKSNTGIVGSMTSIAERIRDRVPGSVSDLGRRHLYWGLLCIVFGFGLVVRYIPVNNMQYLQALDPYMIARMAAGIVEHGHLPNVDAWRFFPYATPTYLLNLGNIFIPAYLFSVVTLFGVNFLTWAQVYPALMGALAIIPAYWIGAELFDRRAGLFSALFMATSPAIMQRSSAGWFEKEPIANVFMVLSIYLFLLAWDREDWRFGIGAGLSTAIAVTAWGGGQYLLLLYPLVIALVMLVPVVMIVPSLILGRDIAHLSFQRGLVTAYTPVALIGPILPAILNGGAWNLFSYHLFGNILVVSGLWVSFLLTKHEVFSEQAMPYVNLGGLSVASILLALSPLYSQTIGSYVMGLIRSATRASGGGSIGGTVAENQAASLTQMVSQLGAAISQGVLPAGAAYADFFSGWSFMIIGVGILVLLVGLTITKDFFEIDEIPFRYLLGSLLVVVAGLSYLMFEFFQGSQAVVFLPALSITSFGVLFVYIAGYLESGYEQWVVAGGGVWVALFLVTVLLRSLVGVVILVTGLGIFIVLYEEFERQYSINVDWRHITLLAWVGSTVYGASTQSRLLLLAATPVAVVAGIAVSKGINQLLATELIDAMRSYADHVDPGTALKVPVIVFVLLVAIVNGAAVYATATGTGQGGGIGGSPNQLWMEHLDWTRENTEPDANILSWWDYGYHFQSIGARTSSSDGGNYGYYTNGNSMGKINYPLAEFLTSSSPEDHLDFLENRGVDYIVLDNTMIGKYSAVSQIANRDNQDFNSMQTLQCRVRDGRCQFGEFENQTVIIYEFGSSDLIVPIEQDGQSMSFAGTPFIRAGQRRVDIAYTCDADGFTQWTNESGTDGGLNSALDTAVQQDRPFGGCVAMDPYRGPAGVVLVPPAIMDSTLVRLYLMDGFGIDFVEESFDNGYVKMWEVTE